MPRLQLIAQSVTVGSSHRVLEAQLPAEWTCARCPALDLYPTGQHGIGAASR